MNDDYEPFARKAQDICIFVILVCVLALIFARVI